MPLQWGKSNKQHRATSQRSRAFTSQYSCHTAAFNDEDVGNGRRFVEVAPFVVGPRHRTPLSVWRRSTARRARRTSTPGVATPLLHATPSRPSSSSCLFSVCLQLAARISAPRGKSTIRTYARVFVRRLHVSPIQVCVHMCELCARTDVRMRERDSRMNVCRNLLLYCSFSSTLLFFPVSLSCHTFSCLYNRLVLFTPSSSIDKHYSLCTPLFTNIRYTLFLLYIARTHVD